MKLWLIPARFDLYTGQKEFVPGLQLGRYFDDASWPWYGKYKHGAYISIHWLLLGGALVGMLMRPCRIGWRRLDTYDLFAIYCMVGVSIIYSVLFYGLGRFHVPVYPLLVIYAVHAFPKWFVSKQARMYRKVHVTSRSRLPVGRHSRTLS